MKNSLIILLIFIAGIAGSALGLLPDFLLHTDMALYALYGLLFLVGIDIGSNPDAWRAIKTINLKIILVPLSIIIGTLVGVSFFSLFMPQISLSDALAVGAGFGYYSLSSIIISQIRGETLGVVALLANLSREIITLLLTPLLVKYLGKLAPIASGGATAMDTTLPIITRFTGKKYAMIAFFSGIVLTIVVPLLVPLVLHG